MTLDEIAIKHGTDKATRHPVMGHGYTPYYEREFAHLRELPIKLLEIGVGGGESIRMWLDYFPLATVIGVDIVEGTNPWNTRRPKAHDRYRFVSGNQTDPIMWKCLLADHGHDWDIIIDDGGHRNNEIIVSFNGLWGAVKPGGFYCIEDLAVGYGAGSVFLEPGWMTHTEFLKSLIDNINKGEREIQRMHCIKELAILQKYV